MCNTIEKVFQTEYGDIHYWVGFVDNALPWLVFLPGLSADHHLFDRQIVEFCGKVNCFVWDAPAHGKSRPFLLKFSMDDLAGYLHDILRAEKIQRLVLVGQSMGGFISQVYMELYPNDVSGFISIDSCPLPRKYYTSAELWMLKHTERMYLSIPWRLLLAWGTHGTAESRYGRSVMKWMMERYGQQEFCALAAHGYRITANAVETGRAYTIPCPVLLLCREKDSAGSVKRYNRSWAAEEQYPLVWVKGAGHNANTDMPALVNSKILQFIMEIVGEQNQCEKMVY